MSVSFKHKICSILIESSQTNLLKLCQNVSPCRKVRQEYPGYAVLFYPVAFLYPIEINLNDNLNDNLLRLLLVSVKKKL